MRGHMEAAQRNGRSHPTKGFVLSPELIEKYLDSLAQSGCTVETLKSYRRKLEQLCQYLPEDKRIFTGATDQLLASDVKLDGISEISRGLEGRSAGVSVQNVSGTFGAAPKIRIRGATSIFGDSKPLWVVDGVIMEDVINVDANSLSSGDATMRTVPALVKVSVPSVIKAGPPATANETANPLDAVAGAETLSDEAATPPTGS